MIAIIKWWSYNDGITRKKNSEIIFEWQWRNIVELYLNDNEDKWCNDCDNEEK